ncbi:MAG: DUF4292 domain-containing protein [Chlorobi bacterium]|nr:DUF4292 domain-containing protein [Chlorobiota bacterium]
MTLNQFQTTQPNIFLRLFVPVALLISTVFSCKSVITSPARPQEVNQQTTIRSSSPMFSLPIQRSFCTYCALSGNLEVRANELTTEGTFKLYLAGRDSLAGTVYGPLGIVAARTYCTRDEFVVFDALAMEAITLSLPSKSLQAILPFPISREDLFSLLRCELPYPDSTYAPVSVDSNKRTVLYMHKDSAFVDLALVNSDGELAAYQRKSPTNQLLFAIEYSNYRQWDSSRYPEHIRVIAPERKIELSVTLDTVMEQVVQLPFRFRLPRTVRTRALN